MQSLGLGTVQLGMKYGIANKCDKPTADESFEILNLAYLSNIRLLDTASAYGDSEEIIGRYIAKTSNVFSISSKLPKMDDYDCSYRKIKEYVLKSIEKLNVNYIEKYFLHDFNMLLKNPKIFSYLKRLMDDNLVKEIGISIYTPQELELILKKFNAIDIVQIPFNVFDQRWNDDLLARTKENNIKIIARSVYLQGLFFADKNKAYGIHKNAVKYIDEMTQFCKDNNLSISEFALKYVTEQDYIDYIIIGAENKKQLLKNVELYNKIKKSGSKDITSFAKENFKNIETKIIDPRLW
ncbi:MAG: aldo/keto reductase [Clostridiaceae bacterium]|jgi:aryl-alcohol dehydrogenase-like predicted oxidoreductase|nr:aldo/keto reductase [Clostridiaceae bacterium]